MSDMAGDCLSEISAPLGVIRQAQAGLFGYNKVLMASGLYALHFLGSEFTKIWVLGQRYLQRDRIGYSF